MKELLAAVDAALAVDVDSLPGGVAAEQALCVRRQIRRLEALYRKLLAAADRSGVCAEQAGSTVAWLRVHGAMDPTEAGRDLGLARDLDQVLPSVTARMVAGEVGVPQAALIATLRTTLTDEVLRAVEPQLAAAAVDCPTSVLRRFTDTVRVQYAPEQTAKREQRQHDQRHFSISTSLHGMGVGSWWLHPAGHDLVLTALRAATTHVDGDERTAAQCRADALLTVCELALASGRLGGQPAAAPPQVTVTVGLGALRGACGVDSGVDRDRRHQPAVLGSGAVVGESWARRLTCDASVARVVFDPAGQPVDLGRATRVFTPAMRRAVVARDGGCVWPGCHAPVWFCDVHHVIHWSQGGATSVCNAVLLCRRHHDRMHTHHHAIVVRSDGTRTVDLRPGSDRRDHAPPRRL